MTDATTPIILSFAGAPEGMGEEEFNEWFNTVHGRELVDHVDGIISVKRYKIAVAMPTGADAALHPFVAVYTLDRPWPEIAANMGEAVAAGKLSDFDWKGRDPLIFFADYVGTIV